MRLLISTCIVAVLSSAVPLRAQSLGDVAKKEEERRKDAKGATKTYSNKDLPDAPAATPAAVDPPTTPVPAPAPSPAAAPTTAPAVSPAPQGATAQAPAGKPADQPGVPAATGEKKPAEGQANDRERWQKRMQALREQLDRNKVLADALQSRLNSLDADFVNRDDPAQRSQLTADRNRTSAELTRLKKAIAADERAIPELEEEARRAGVPAGWLR